MKERVQGAPWLTTVTEAEDQLFQENEEVWPESVSVTVIVQSCVVPAAV